MTARRSIANCDCGGPCFYCGRALAKHRHEHDHFPIPWRHGGEATVPTCVECHAQKDLTRLSDFANDAALAAAVEAGMSGLGWVSVNGEKAPWLVWWLYEHIQQPVMLGADWPYDWVKRVENAGEALALEISRCTTPEARIWLAGAFNVYLDRLDGALQRGEGWRPGRMRIKKRALYAEVPVGV